MHVLVTTDAVGGVWTYTRELVTGLVRRGFRITLVSFGDLPTPEQTNWLDGLSVDFRPTPYRLEWMQDAESDFSLSTGFLERVIDDVRPDLLHLNQFGYGRVARDLPRIVVAHSDCVSWWQCVKHEPPPESRWMRWYRRAVQQGLEGADVVVAPSKWMLETLVSIYGVARDARVIYNGRNPALFNPLLTKDDLVITVGRLWDEAKQARLLMEANCNVPVFVAGNQRHPSGSQHAFEENGNEWRASVGGRQSDLQLMQLYSRASIYAATSCYEPFGLAPTEAALSRCALLCNDIPVFHELWGDSAVFFKRDDAHSLREQIELLHSDGEARREYANRAYHHARERFNAAKMVDDYVALYRSFVSAEVAA